MTSPAEYAEHVKNRIFDQIEHDAGQLVAGAQENAPGVYLAGTWFNLYGGKWDGLNIWELTEPAAVGWRFPDGGIGQRTKACVIHEARGAHEPLKEMTAWLTDGIEPVADRYARLRSERNAMLQKAIETTQTVTVSMTVTPETDKGWLLRIVRSVTAPGLHCVEVDRREKDWLAWTGTLGVLIQFQWVDARNEAAVIAAVLENLSWPVRDEPDLSAAIGDELKRLAGVAGVNVAVWREPIGITVSEHGRVTRIVEGEAVPQGAELVPYARAVFTAVDTMLDLGDVHETQSLYEQAVRRITREKEEREQEEWRLARERYGSDEYRDMMRREDTRVATKMDALTAFRTPLGAGLVKSPEPRERNSGASEPGSTRHWPSHVSTPGWED